MDYKYILADKLKNEITFKIKQQFNRTIEDLIQDETSKIKSKFINDLDIHKDIYCVNLNDFVLLNGFIRFCDCNDCKTALEYDTNGKHPGKKTHPHILALADIKDIKPNPEFKPLNDEYIIYCNIISYPSSNDIYDNNISITNYGRYFHSARQYGNKHYIGLSGEQIPITREYFELLKLIKNPMDLFKKFEFSSSGGTGSGLVLKQESIDKFIGIYTKYNPKAKDLLVIEEKNKKLQNKENKLNEDVKKKELEIERREEELKKNEEKLQIDIQKINEVSKCIKVKYKNLFDREEQIKLNESIYSCCVKLKEAALQLDSLIAITDIDNIKIQQNVNNVLGTLNHLTD